MTRFYIHEDDEPRECSECEGTGCDVDPAASVVFQKGCVRCNGTGRLGREGHEPEIEIDEFKLNGESIGHFWRRIRDDSSAWRGKANGPNSVIAFPTETEALTAAREALG